MELKIPYKVEQIINEIGNETRQKNAYKIYAAIYRMEIFADKEGYFPLPSIYLKKINSRYKSIMDELIKNNIIEYKHSIETDPNSLVDIKRKCYNVFIGKCMMYKFLIDINVGKKKNIDFENRNRYRWYDIVKNSLDELGYFNQKISRSAFGRRVYYPILTKYKKKLYNKGFTIIDAKTSQPKLLRQELKKSGINDENFEKAFQNDFYIFLKENLKLKDREEGKKIFVHYLNGKGYSQDKRIYDLFPEVSMFLRKLKKRNYKDVANHFQKIESTIWIDNLLNDLPVNFGLPVHDCLIVKDEDSEKVLEYCKSKCPEIDFVMKQLKDQQG